MIQDPKELVFLERPDLTPYLVHLTKNTLRSDSYSAMSNLISILEKGEIWGSNSTRGFVKGPHKAACFMDVPFAALKHILNSRNATPANPRYEPYGLVVTKKYAYKHGCRPVLYLSDAETTRLRIPKDELWRVVRFEPDGTVNWIHEREWRCRGDFSIPGTPFAALVKTASEAKKLNSEIARRPNEFKAKPYSIIPLEIVCQGLPYLQEKP